ncbi:MAG: ATP-binding protein [Clostridia bacterium]|nr:ATP-binding protein [Clostridia bacterium]
MNNSILNDLLKQYEKKRLNNIRDLENRKKELYLLHPELQEIDNKLTKISIKTAKSILQKNSENSLSTLKKEVEKLKTEKKELLKNFNIPQNYLSINYNCNICKDTGYITKNGVTTMCNCLKQQIYNIEYNQKNINKIDNNTFDNFNINLFSNIVDEKKYHSKISPRENILEIKNVAIDFINNFESSNTKNLIFSGGTGLGKTFLSNCIINQIIKNGKTVMYQTAPVMLDNLIADLFAKPENQSGISKNLLSVDLLVIDDLGTETMNSMKFTELYKIINTRLLNQNGKFVKTIISTNLDLKGLFNTYDERLASRFIGYYNIYRFYGDDIRLKQ